MFRTTLSAIGEFAIPLTDALLLCLIGMAIVFAVLIVLMGIIWVMGKIMEKSPAISAKISPKFKNLFKRNKKGEETTEEAPKANGTCGELVLINTDERDAAMIMAIVADTTGIPLNELRFKSIKRIDE
ncbi:MAG: OadG family protein [Clostridia bacterium]|nr:OadG family protein [Clostridia bacterium]